MCNFSNCLLLSVVGLAFLLLSCTAVGGTEHSSTASSGAIEALVRLASERIAIADDVALTKWDSHRPVLDAERENAVIAEVTQSVPHYAVESSDVVVFFRAQIEANKWVQYQDLNRWQLQGCAPNKPRPNKPQLRQQLDALQQAILQQLAAVHALSGLPQCRLETARAISLYAKHAGLDKVHRLALVRALGDFCHS